MQIMNSKAYYLNNYSVRKRHKTEHQDKSHNRSQDGSRFEELMQIKNINRLAKEPLHASQGSTSTFAKGSVATACLSKRRDGLNVYAKEKSVLQRVIDRKSQENQKRRSFTVDIGKSRVTIERHPLGEINPLEVESMKPTDRYFHMMENVRMAERLLLARPSQECSSRKQKQFYHQQRDYKANITRLNFRTKRENRQSRAKMLNRRKWVD